MSDQKDSYRQIFKATSLFGGVQLFEIIIKILQSKAVAVLIGPAGMGIVGLFQSTIGIIGRLTSFGLSTSAVKNVASAYESGDDTRIAIVVTVLRRWVWVTGLLGSIIMLCTAPWLSEITFGNRNYSWSFVFIAVTLLLNQLTNGQQVLLQGTRKLRLLAKASLLSSLSGLLITVPLYFFYGKKGIVPVIIVSALITFLINAFYSNKIGFKKIRVSKARTFLVGKEMLIMGFMISLSSLISSLGSHLIKIFISNTGGVDQVGLYTAGISIVLNYVSLVFTAMSKDYYPRLSSVAENTEKARLVINQQAQIAILILSPMVAVFLVYIKWIIILLYSTQFVGIDWMINWAILGILFKATGWSLGFLLLAKGAAKMFFWNELAANLYNLAFNIIGYYFYGLTGLGISYLVGYIVYSFQMVIVSKKYYDFKFSNEFIKNFIVFNTLLFASFGIVSWLAPTFKYIIGSMLILLVSAYSIYELNRYLDLRNLIKKYLRK